MATAIVSGSKSPKWFSPKNYFKSKPKPQNTPTQDHTTTTNTTSTTTKSSTRIEEYRRVFSHFDTNGDGKISPEELRSYFASIGDEMSRDEARSAVGGEDDESLDFDGFVKLMERDGGGERNDDDDLKMAFEMFEGEDRGSRGGCITPKGLQKMLSRLGDSRSYEECVSMIGAYDIDGNGVLDFHEFVRMMNHSN